MSSLEEQVQALRQRLALESTRVRAESDLAAMRTLFFGRKGGLLTAALKGLGAMAPAERADAGQLLNQVKAEVESRLETLTRELARGAETGVPGLDLTLPGRAAQPGHRHPLTLIQEELEEIFLGLGFSIAEGPELDDDFHCFEALNIPRDHPARDMQDTLYALGTPGGVERVLRPHTSNVQIRTMESQPPPIRVISIGRCYRRDTPDFTHSPMFHQIEGLVVDHGVSLAHLKGTLEYLSRRLFTASTGIRLRPSFFPFTEPSAELDISCFGCDGRGCALCKGSGFIELGGCGMVDPNVFLAVGIDPERYTGFAFGLGIERTAMLKHAIDNIRLFFENDVRFLEQFPSLV